jgi:hypothetical protein
VSPARYRRVRRGLTSRITPLIGGGLDTIRRYRMLIGGDWVDAEKFVHLDLSGRLDRRAYPLLLSTPPA